jgi:UDP-N-acetylmuramate dehydrogenase
MLLQEHISLAPLTTLGVGGPARYFAEAGDEAEVREAVEFARSRSLPLFVLGSGSNVVVSDAGFPGLVLKLGMQEFAEEASEGRIALTAEAGADWDTLVASAVKSDAAGVECLSGIPGTVGGTPIQNVGAYGQEVAQTIREVRALDLHSLETVTFSNAECGFGYRSSRFNTADRGRYIILRVTFLLTPGAAATVAYPDLQKRFAARVKPPSLAAVRDAVLEIRRSKAMLIVPGDEDARSAGSFFKNPVVPAAACAHLVSCLAARGLDLPSYPAGEGHRKLPAAWLVEHAGFAKGYRKGAAGISRRHALALINRGGATAAEMLALRDEIQSRVEKEFGLRLQPEPVMVGF